MTLTTAAATAVDIAGAGGATVSTITQTAAATATITNAGSADLTLATSIAAGQTFKGGSGKDTVTFANTNTNANTMGAGDDTVTLAAVMGTGGSVDGGDGTDTVTLTTANAVTLSAATTFEADISNFEKVSLGQIAATFTNSTINMANLDDINSVVLAGAADNTQGSDETLTISGLSSGAT